MGLLKSAPSPRCYIECRGSWLSPTPNPVAFDESNLPKLFEQFALFEGEAKRLLDAKLSLPGYEMILKAAHTFNLLDARGAISVTERAAYIGRIRTLSRLVAQAYVDSREALGFPMLADIHRKAAA